MNDREAIQNLIDRHDCLVRYCRGVDRLDRIPARRKPRGCAMSRFGGG